MVKYENNIINYILLALACMNFMQSGSLILIIFCLYNLFFVKDRLDGTAMILVLMGLSMFPAILSAEEAPLSSFVKVVNYFLPYYIGYNGYHKAKDKMLYIKRTLLAMFLGYSLQIVFDFFYNLSLGSSGRVLISIWTEEPIAVTLIGLLSSFVIGYAFAVILTDKSKLHRILCAASMVFVVLINMQTATRTPFLMMLLMACCFLFVFVFEKSDTAKTRYLFIFAVLGLGLLAAIYFNLFGFKDLIFSSDLFKRFTEEGLETGRDEIAAVYFDNMIDYPWGGSNVYKLYGLLPHNIWQQMYDDYGCVPCVFLIFFTVLLINGLIKILRLQNKQTVDYILIGIYTVSLVQMGLEPLLTGYPILFWGLLLIHGITTNYFEERSIGQIQIA